MNRRHRLAFTVIELVVVVAIVALLLAVLIPAVQAARATARQTGCASNLRQIGLGLQYYHNTNQQFPPGAIATGDCCTSPYYTTWTIAILPYVEKLHLYDSYDQDLPNEHLSNMSVVQTFVPLYLCPSDVNTKYLDLPRNGPGKKTLWAPGSYRAVSGATTSENGEWFFDNSSVTSDLPLNWRGLMHVVRSDKNLTTESFSNIKDGTSFTMVVGEFHTDSFNPRRTFWAYAYNSFNQSSVQKQRRTMIPDYDKCKNLFGPGDENACKRAFASFHRRRGMNGLMGDGAVRYLNLQKIDLDVWWSLGTISGNDIEANHLWRQ